MKQHIVAGAVTAALVAAAVVAGCGGGGGGALIRPGGGGNPSPSPSPSQSPTVTLGNLNYATGGSVGGFTYAAANGYQVVFTCGCSNQAGTTVASSTGGFSVTSPASPTPAAPHPTYTIVPTRNYLIEAQPVGGNAGPQAWTMMFAGTQASHDLALGDTGAVAASTGTSDVYTTAVALYVYSHSTQGSNTAFDDWNFTSLQTWMQDTLIAAPSAEEITLMDDIASQSGANNSLFPFKPGWNSAQTINAKIMHDVDAITSVNDPSVPTPCPGGEGTCTGTPTP